MAEYLLNSNLLVIVSIASAFAWFLFYQKSLRGIRLKRLLIAVAVSVCLFAIEIYIIWTTFGLDSTPAGAYWITFACNSALALIVLGWKHRHAVVYGSLALFCSLILLVVSINDYYQYFPTLSSIFVPQRRQDIATTTVAIHQQLGQAHPTLEGTLFGNTLNHGTIVTTTIPGTISRLQTRDAYIYLPPAYGDAAFKNAEFPVLVLLTGTPGVPSSWLQGDKFTAAMDQFASRHKGISPIVVIADHSGTFTNDTECVDSPHGNADTYLTQDVPTYMKQRYHVSSNPTNWGIGGFSEGGMCAAMLTLKHQNVYRHFLDLAGDPYPYLNNQSQTLPVLFYGSKQAQKTSDVDWLLTHQPLSQGLSAQFAIGANDNKHLIAELRRTYHLAVHEKIPASYESVAHQGHTFAAWSRSYTDALPKLSYYLGATSCEAGCTE